MSTIERLAANWGNTKEPEDEHYADARWWGLAWAEELETRADEVEREQWADGVAKSYVASAFRHAAKHIRSQVGEE